MSTQMQNNDFLLDTINEAIDAGADAIATQYALQRLNENGSVNIQECATIYLMAKEILTEGNEDLIPDNIELPEDDELGEDGEDLDVSDLEGIVLPTADGGLMVIENGVLVPYSEEAAATPAGEPAPKAPEAALNESETNVEGSAEEGSTDEGQNELNENTNAGENPDTQTIEESADLSKHSSVVQSLISQMNFSKGGF